jgi:hypothetical protein
VNPVAMSDMAWLILALIVGALTALGWVVRERAIHRRRRARAALEGDKR